MRKSGEGGGGGAPIEGLCLDLTAAFSDMHLYIVPGGVTTVNTIFTVVNTNVFFFFFFFFFFFLGGGGGGGGLVPQYIWVRSSTQHESTRIVSGDGSGGGGGGVNVSPPIVGCVCAAYSPLGAYSMKTNNFW